MRLIGQVIVPALSDAASISGGDRRLLDLPSEGVVREVEAPLVRAGNELGTHGPRLAGRARGRGQQYDELKGYT